MPSSWPPVLIGSMVNRHKVWDVDEATLDPADADQPQGPERRCIVTGLVQPKADLLRLVVGPEGQLVVDLARKLPGRGIWLSPRRDVINTAMAKKAFARAAKRQVLVAADLADQIESLLVGRCLNNLGMARRAGQAIAGYEKVRAEITARRAGMVIEASDGSVEATARMRALGSGLPVVDLFTSSELGEVFGRETTVHAVLTRGVFVPKLLDLARFLAGFRSSTILGCEG